MKRIKTGLSTSLRVPSPPGTNRKSSLGHASTETLGFTDNPLAQEIGSSDCATRKQFLGPAASTLHILTISHGPTKSNSSTPGNTRMPKFTNYSPHRRQKPKATG